MNAFYVCKTMLGGPDVNRRSIYRADYHSHVKTFNYEMKPWTPDMQAELNAELASLYAAEQQTRIGIAR